MAAQITHAAGESVRGRVDSGTHAVVLSVPTEADLLAVAEQLAHFGIDHVLILEPDAPWNNQAMAIGLAPVSDCRMVRRVLGRLSLLT